MFQFPVPVRISTLHFPHIEKKKNGNTRFGIALEIQVLKLCQQLHKIKLKTKHI